MTEIIRIEEKISNLKTDLVNLQIESFNEDFNSKLRDVELQIHKSEEEINSLTIEDEPLSDEMVKLKELIAMKEACLFIIKLNRCKDSLEKIDEFSLFNLERILSTLKSSTLATKDPILGQIKVFSTYINSYVLKFSEICRKFDHFWNDIFKFSQGISENKSILRSFEFDVDPEQLKLLFSISKFIYQRKPEYCFVGLVENLFNDIMRPFLNSAFAKNSHLKLECKDNGNGIKILFIKDILANDNQNMNNKIKGFIEALKYLKLKLFQHEEEDLFMKAFHDLKYPKEMYLLLQKNFISQCDDHCLTLANIKFLEKFGYFDNGIVDEFTRFVEKNQENSWYTEVVSNFEKIINSADFMQLVEYSRKPLKSTCYFNINELLVQNCTISQNIIDMRDFINGLLNLANETSKDFYTSQNDESLKVIKLIPTLITNYFLERLRLVNKNADDLKKCITFHNDFHYLGEFIIEILPFKIRPIIEQLVKNSEKKDFDFSVEAAKASSLIAIRSQMVREGTSVLLIHFKKYIQNTMICLVHGVKLEKCDQKEVDETGSTDAYEKLIAFFNDTKTLSNGLSSVNQLKLLGALVNVMIIEIVEIISRLKDITIKGNCLATFILKRVQKWAPNFVKILYLKTLTEEVADEEISMSQIKSILTHLNKMEGIIQILEAESLTSIVMHLWNHGKGPLKKIYGLAPDLVHSFIKKLYADGPQRLDAINKIN